MKGILLAILPTPIVWWSETLWQIRAVQKRRQITTETFALLFNAARAKGVQPKST